MQEKKAGRGCRQTDARGVWLLLCKERDSGERNRMDVDGSISFAYH
jgi:hypothetical protein